MNIYKTKTVHSLNETAPRAYGEATSMAWFLNKRAINK